MFVPMAFTALLLCGCGAHQPQVGNGSGDAIVMVWPPAPATARISFVRSIGSPQDMGIRKSLIRRLADTFTGGSDIHFVRPSGVAHRDGVLYVADPGARSVWILDPVINRTTGVHRTGETELVSPVAVAVRADGAVFVADSVLAKVLLLDRKGNYLGVAAETGLQRPVGLVYDDHNGRLYVADSTGQSIHVFDAHGSELFSWGSHGNAKGEFNYPTHLAFGHDGELLVTDSLNFRIQSFDRDGNFLWQFGHHGDSSGSFASPKGLAVDSGQHVYVVDALFDSVQLFGSDGTLLLSFGGQGSGPGQFWLPGGLFIDAQDHIFVSDTYNHRIQEFRFLDANRQGSQDEQP
ncbi:MAG: 6-bladed beta-propeller [Proteobacteria bacterium]|nr:6-bladed beta-propeller [Pseudomonadota bacterium]